MKKLSKTEKIQIGIFIIIPILASVFFEKITFEFAMGGALAGISKVLLYSKERRKKIEKLEGLLSDDKKIRDEILNKKLSKSDKFLIYFGVLFISLILISILISIFNLKFNGKILFGVIVLLIIITKRWISNLEKKIHERNVKIMNGEIKIEDLY